MDLGVRSADLTPGLSSLWFWTQIIWARGDLLASLKLCWWECLVVVGRGLCSLLVVFDHVPIVSTFLFLLQPLDPVTMIRPIMMRKVLAFFVPDVVVFRSDLKEWILHPWLLRSLSFIWCLFQFWCWTLVHVKKLYSYYTMPWGMSDKKHVHESPDWGMTKRCLLHSHLKTRCLLQLRLLFFGDSWKVPHVWRMRVVRLFGWGLCVTPSSWCGKGAMSIDRQGSAGRVQQFSFWGWMEFWGLVVIGSRYL